MNPKEQKFYAEVGRRLRKRRKLLQLSLFEISALTKIKFQQLAKFEHGENRPTIFQLFKICAALQTTVFEILHLIDLPANEPTNPTAA